MKPSENNRETRAQHRETNADGELLRHSLRSIAPHSEAVLTTAREVGNARTSRLEESRREGLKLVWQAGRG